MKLRVSLELDIDTCLDPCEVDNIVNNIDFNKLIDAGNDVVDVNYVDVDNFSIV